MFFLFILKIILVFVNDVIIRLYIIRLYMKKNYNKIINEIQKIRTKNNVNWMNILRVAMKFAPNQTKKIVKSINTNDKKISSLISKLSK
jgi:hypothetical protein